MCVLLVHRKDISSDGNPEERDTVEIVDYAKTEHAIQGARGDR
jgi:hypothetical protein